MKIIYLQYNTNQITVQLQLSSGLVVGFFDSEKCQVAYQPQPSNYHDCTLLDIICPQVHLNNFWNTIETTLCKKSHRLGDNFSYIWAVDTQVKAALWWW